MKKFTVILFLFFSSIFLFGNFYVVSADDTNTNYSIPPLDYGIYPVGSTNFEIDNEVLSEKLKQGLDAGQFQQGYNLNGELLYIAQLLKYPESAFTVEVKVPDEPENYGDSAGTTMLYTGYVFYPTSPENHRNDYEVFLPPALPHMQGKDDKPIFPDEQTKYPLIVYSHGLGDYPGAFIADLIKIASHGYVVLALYHGDNRFSRNEMRTLFLRPLAIKAAIDKLQNDSDFASHINFEKVGGIGTSYGGTTMMALTGAKVLGMDYVSFMTGKLKETVQDNRIKAIATIVPYMGDNFYKLFGNDCQGVETLSAPILINAAKNDDVASFDIIEKCFKKIPTDKYLVAYENESHTMSTGAMIDAITWSKVFLDAYTKDNNESISILNNATNVEGGGEDNLITKVYNNKTDNSTSYTTPIFKDNTIILPLVKVGDKFYNVELVYVQNSSPLQFRLTKADIIDVENIESSVTYENGSLIIPSIDVLSQKFEVKLALSDYTNLIFTLTDAQKK